MKVLECGISTAAILFTVLIAFFCSTEVFADGFAIKDQSPTAGGTSYAGAASTVEDPSVIFYNPAGLTYLKGTHFLAAVNVLAATYELKSSSGTLPALLGGVPAGGASTDGNIGLDAVVPVFYGSMDLTEDLKIGFGINSPFGLGTSYNEGWQGRFHAVTSKLTTINFNPVIAYRLSDKLSIGGGVQVGYADTRLNNAILTTSGEGFFEIEADDFGLGWSIGVLAEPLKGTRFGISYRSHISHQMEGTATITPAIGAPVKVDGRGDLDLPETVRLGISQDIGSRVILHLGAAWRRWSRIDSRSVNFDAPVGILAGAMGISTNADWKNTWFLSAGATYRPTSNWTFRFGVGHDETPVPDTTRGPGIPGTNAVGVSFGTSYRVSDRADVTLAYTHVFLDDATISLTNPATGNLNAEFESEIDLLSVQGRIRF